MATEDLKQYAQEMFRKAGVSQAMTDAFVQTLGDPTVEKAFREGFVPTSQHHSTIDKMKGEWEGKYTQADSQVKAWNEWWAKNGATIQAIPETYQRLQAYEQTYGKLDMNSSNSEIRQAAQASGLTKQEVEEMLAQRTQTLAQATSTLMKDVAYITADHQQRFKEPLDLDKLEEYAAKSGLPLRQAYKEFISPKSEEIRNAEFEARLKAAKEEAVRDYASKHQLPVETKPKEPHPIFDQKAPDPQLNEFQRERNSKEAFLNAWNNYNEEPAKAS